VALERERKYQIDMSTVQRVRALLVAAGGSVRCEMQRNVIFSPTPQGVLLRLRETEGSISGRELTAKQDRSAEPFEKVRDELTVQLGGGPVEELLNVLGYRAVLEYEKRTEIFFSSAVAISLDDVTGLGYFCEIEAIDPDADLGSVAARLSLSDSALESRSYPELVLAHADR